MSVIKTDHQSKSPFNGLIELSNSTVDLLYRNVSAASEH